MMALGPSRDMTRIAAALVCVGVLCSSGCRWTASNRAGSLEAQIRAQDARIIGLTQSLGETRAELNAANVEGRALRESLDNLTAPPSTEQAENSFRVTDIEIVSLLSGGLDRDDEPGDELLTLLLSPQDESGETLRTDGTLTVEVFDFSQTGEQQRIGLWEFAGRDLADLWHSGVIGRGFRLVKPWQTAPSSGEVTVHVRLVSSDGRQFNQTGRLTVTPPGQNSDAVTTR
jgi:hypothetical protein